MYKMTEHGGNTERRTTDIGRMGIGHFIFSENVMENHIGKTYDLPDSHHEKCIT